MVETLEAFVESNASMPDIDVFVNSFSVCGLYVMATMAATLCNLRENKEDDEFMLSKVACIRFLSELRKLFLLMNDPAQASIRDFLADRRDDLDMPANLFTDDAEFSSARKKVFSYAQMKILYLDFYTVALLSGSYEHSLVI